MDVLCGSEVCSEDRKGGQGHSSKHLPIFSPPAAHTTPHPSPEACGLVQGRDLGFSVALIETGATAGPL